MTLHAVVLAGGSGTRFWPRSTAAVPKQFLALGGGRTLIQETVARLSGLVPEERVRVVTGEAYVPLVRAQLPALPAANVIAEPAPRDTAAAIGLAARLVADEAGGDAVVAVLPSDHRIAPAERFRAALAQAEELARGGRIVTLGVLPTRPATGYGYVRRGALLGAPAPFPASAVEAFEEKPDQARAERLVAEGRHAWNAGIFVFEARALLDALARHLPATRAAIDRIAAARGEPGAAAVLAREWAGLERISIDKGVLEKEPRIAVIDVDFEWSDVGSWDAVAEVLAADSCGNVVDAARFVGLDASNNIVAGDGRLVAIVGLSDVVVVQAGDAVLVCPRARAEDVKRLVAELGARGLGEYL